MISDPLRTDGSHASADASTPDRDAKIEQLLLVGLDHYFAARYDLAINVWTRALFLDRNHARARAYIERARSALAERQRECEELLQTGLAAFNRGESGKARRLLQAAIDGGAPSDEALAVLERLNRLENATTRAPVVASTEPPPRQSVAAAGTVAPGARGATFVAASLAIGLAAFVGWAVWTERIDWRWFDAAAPIAGSSAPAVTRNASPVALDAPLPLPRRGEDALARARALAASGHLRDALALVDGVRPTDPQHGDAERLRGDIQRQLLALTTLPSPAAEKVERRDR